MSEKLCKKERFKTKALVLIISALFITSCVTSNIRVNDNRITSTIDLGAKVTNLKEATRATIQIHSNSMRATGTAFHIGNGIYATASHCVVNFHGNIVDDIENMHTKERLSVVKVDTKLDLALLKGEVVPNMRRFVINKNPRKVGDILVTLGWHMGQVFLINKGHISGLTEDFIFHNAVANPGVSGGPTIDHNYEVVGVTIAGLTYSGGYNGVVIATRGKRLFEFVKEYLNAQTEKLRARTESRQR